MSKEPIVANQSENTGTTSENSVQKRIELINRLEMKESKPVTALLKSFCEFLEKNGYTDSDWRDELPTAIDRFLPESKSELTDKQYERLYHLFEKKKEPVTEGKTAEEIDQTFCHKRILEQDDYINELNTRKATLTIDRYLELLYSAVERKDYFYKQLIRIRNKSKKHNYEKS